MNIVKCTRTSQFSKISNSLLQNEKLRIRLSGFPLEEIPALSEAFITSTSRAVLSVTRIDNLKIGNGLPGPITNRLLERYQQRVSVEVQPI